MGLASCGEVDNPHRPYPKPDFETYVAEIQPIVTDRCGYIACHGTQDRNLTLYAPGFLRAPPSFPGKPLDENELEQGELNWNYDALRVRLLSTTSAESSRLLLKLLDPSEGGIVHADGVVVFEDRTAPDYQTLQAWIAGAL